MSAYAPNPTSSRPSSAEYGAASLTASLLARKGEALPAVDAQAHAGVDIDMAPVAPGQGKGGHGPGGYSTGGHNTGATSPRSRLQAAAAEPVETVIYPANPSSSAHRSLHTLKAETIEPAPSMSATAEAGTRVKGKAPENWTAMSSRSKLRRFQKRGEQRNPAQDTGRKATVTFKMPAKEFIRMRFAARELEMSCQSILLDALSSYLDANDVAPVPDDICEKETARLRRRMQKARSGR